MKFRLDPPSGHADSYLDIRFFVDFNRCEKAEVRLFNDSIEQPLEILAVSKGYIVDGKVATIRNAADIDGFISLFNRDKMNSALNEYTCVNIRCELSLFNKDEVEKFTFTETFYNESKSLDAAVLPFDIEVHNPEIKVDKNEPLRMSIISTENRFYELSIRNEQGTRYCTFDVFAKKGKTDFILPCEVLFSDLDIPSTQRQKNHFGLFWSKFEGVDYSKFVNRKRIRVPNCRITILGDKIMPQPQTRIDPVGGQLSADFVLSDRYLVHTHKDYSGFGAKSFDSIRMKRLTFFHHEALDMNNPQINPHDDIKSSKLQNILSQGDAIERPKIKSFGISKQKKFLTTFSPVFAKRATTRPVGATTTKTPTEAPKKKTGGCAGCGRKKR